MSNSSVSVTPADGSSNAAPPASLSAPSSRTQQLSINAAAVTAAAADKNAALLSADRADASDLPAAPRTPHTSAARTYLSPPLCNFVDAMLTESAGLLMAYAHWQNGRHELNAVFDLFFRVHPFEGEFTIFAGLEEVLRFIQTFRLSKEDIRTLKRKFPQEWDARFFQWLEKVDMSAVRLYAVPEGSVVFPRLPLMRVHGPLGVCSLLESTLLVLVNYASLIATNAARHRLAVGEGKTLLEFGLRRAQGPDGAMSASRYAYVGGFDGTSNVKAGTVFSMPLKGTHAHSFVVSFYSLQDLKDRTLVYSSSHAKKGEKGDFLSSVLRYRSELKRNSTHEGELAAFVAYAQAFPDAFMGLLDTFDTLESGIWNYVIVALALVEFGYTPIGIRLDSGDLAYLSRECRKIFRTVADAYGNERMKSMTIVASNDLSENVLYALKEQGHEIDAFGVGTNLVTCKTQPALGCVYKLVEVDGQPRMKVSSDHDKVTIPGEKEAYRLFNAAGEPVLDLLVQAGASAPQVNKRILCRHPFDANKRVYVTPAAVEPLHRLCWDGLKHSKGINVLQDYPTLEQVRAHVKAGLKSFREDHLRRVNPTPYKLSVSSDLFSFMQDLWLQETPIAEIS